MDQSVQWKRGRTLKNRPKAGHVWTPRSHVVNPQMYIVRQAVESDLSKHLGGSLNVLLCGQSGIGKSWMYKKVCGDLNIKYHIADSANTSRLQSFDQLFETILNDMQPRRHKSSKESKSAKGNIMVAEGSIQSESEFEIRRADPFLELVKELHKKKISLLVFENLERIASEELLTRHLGDLVALLDNPYYAKFGVRLLLVGAIDDAAQFFRRSKSQETIGNRLREIPIYHGLSKDSVGRLCKIGFNDILGAELESRELAFLTQKVAYLSLGIPQRVQELCYEVALQMESMHYQFSSDDLETMIAHAEFQLVRGSLVQFHTNLVDRLSPLPNTRKNQVLFAISQVDAEQFTVKTVQMELKSSFPGKEGQFVGAGQILRALSDGEGPILRRTNKRGTYEFSHTGFRMVIRSILSVKGGCVQVRDVTQGNYKI